jgi:hypothetical protein
MGSASCARKRVGTAISSLWSDTPLRSAPANGSRHRANDRIHGQRFKARFLRTSAPSTVDGIEKYLASGMIRGIGPVYAKKLVRIFGDKVFDVIEA